MQASSHRRLHKVLRQISATGGWLLFFYEWVHVSGQTPRTEPIQFLILLIAATVLMHSGIAAWIAHNKRLAAKGKRGLMTRYIVPRYTHDYLGRPLLIDADSRLSPEVLVKIDGNTKLYLPAPAVPTVRRQQNVVSQAESAAELGMPVAELV